MTWVTVFTSVANGLGQKGSFNLLRKLFNSFATAVGNTSFHMSKYMSNKEIREYERASWERK